MDNNRTIIAVVLIVLLWSGYSLFFAPQPPMENQVVPEEKVVSEQKPEKNIVKNVAEKKDDFVPVKEVQTIKVKSDYYEIELSSLGASVKSIQLDKYKQEKDEKSGFYQLFDGKSDNLSTLVVSGIDGLYIPSTLNYNIDKLDSVVELKNEIVKLNFTAEINKIKILKQFVFYPSSYSIDLNIIIENIESDDISGKLSLSLITPYNSDEKKKIYTFVGPESYDGKDLLDDKIKDIEKSPKIYSNDIVWSGYTSKYFLSAVNPKNSAEQTFISKSDTFIENKFISPQIYLKENNSVEYNYSAYFGPKQLEFLSESQNHFEEAIHYGFFHPLAKPLMVVLKFFYKYIGNYGIAIILLTVCIKILFWPLTQKSYKSMKSMQKLQPEMKRLREKYGSDKQRLNQELMGFYKENKVNPLGGCLPMLIQIPVFFALYRVLLGSIELRHAPFMLWITDLSAKDPYYVTPLIMGATMFLQQKMTPTNMDPTQEKIMLMMPVVFTFMFLNFPSGLVIYWLVNNVLTILQQYIIRRQPD